MKQKWNLKSKIIWLETIKQPIEDIIWVTEADTVFLKEYLKDVTPENLQLKLREIEEMWYVLDNKAIQEKLFPTEDIIWVTKTDEVFLEQHFEDVTPENLHSKLKEIEEMGYILDDKTILLKLSFIEDTDILKVSFIKNLWIDFEKTVLRLNGTIEKLKLDWVFFEIEDESKNEIKIRWKTEENTSEIKKFLDQEIYCGNFNIKWKKK